MARNNRNNYKYRREQEIPEEINNIVSDYNFRDWSNSNYKKFV